MQISPLNVESLLPVANRGGSSGPEGNGDFSSSLREQEQSRSSQKVTGSEPARRTERQGVGKKTREVPTRNVEGSDRPQQEAEPLAETDKSETGHARSSKMTVPSTDADPPMESVRNASLPDAGEVPVPVTDLPPLGEVAPVLVQPPSVPVDTTAVQASALLADVGPVEVTGPSPLIDKSPNPVPVVPVAELTGVMDTEPVQLRPPPDLEANGAELSVEDSLVVVVAKDSAGLPAEPEIPVAKSWTDVDMDRIMPAGLAGDKGASAASVVPSVGLVDPSVQPQPPADFTPLSPTVPETPLAAGSLKDSQPVAAPTAESTPKFGVSTEHRGQEPPVAGALPIIDGKTVVESLLITPLPTAKPVANQVSSVGAELVAAAAAEGAQTQVAVSSKKPLWVKMATAGDTSDRRFAQLLGEKTFSVPAPEAAAKLSVPAVAAEPVAVTVDGLVPDPEEALVQVGNEGPTKALAESESVGLPREAGPMVGGQSQFGGAVSQAVGGGQPAPTGSSLASPTQTTGQSLPLPIAEENIYQQVAGRISMVAGERHSRITMNLYPEELGQVKLEMVVEGDRVRVQLHAQSQQVQDVLEKYLPKLRESFEQQGLKLENVQVSSDSPQQGGKGFYQDPRQLAPTARYASRTSLLNDDDSAIESPIVPLPSGRAGSINVRI